MALAVLVFAGVLLGGTPAPAAQVVIVKSSDAEPYAQADAALRDALAERHYAVRSLLAKEASDKGIAASFGQADAVVAVGTPAARWLHKQLPANVRLVYCMVNSAEEAGLLEGRDCWGVTTEVPLAEEFKLIGEALPRARTLGALYRSDTADGKKTLQSLKAAAPDGWGVVAVAVNESPSVAAAIDALMQKNVDVVWTSAEQKLYDAAAVRALLLGALRNKTPVWGFSPAFVRAGALLGVGVEPRAQGSQAADLLARLLADPKAAPKEARDKAQPPREFQVAVNLIVARQLGVEIPDALSRRAAYVYRSEN